MNGSSGVESRACLPCNYLTAPRRRGRFQQVIKCWKWFLQPVGSAGWGASTNTGLPYSGRAVVNRPFLGLLWARLLFTLSRNSSSVLCGEDEELTVSIQHPLLLRHYQVRKPLCLGSFPLWFINPMSILLLHRSTRFWMTGTLFLCRSPIRNLKKPKAKLSTSQTKWEKTTSQEQTNTLLHENTKMIQSNN